MFNIIQTCSGLRARIDQFFYASTNCLCIPIFNVPTGSACHAIIFVWVRMSRWNHKAAAFMEKPTLWTKVCLWKWRAQALDCSASALVFVAILRYHLLCIKHFGWLWLVIFLLQVPKHLSAVDSLSLLITVASLKQPLPLTRIAGE